MFDIRDSTFKIWMLCWIEFDIRYSKFECWIEFYIQSFRCPTFKHECYVGLSLIFDIQNLNVGLSFIFNHFDVRHSKMNVRWDWVWYSIFDLIFDVQIIWVLDWVIWYQSRFLKMGAGLSLIFEPRHVISNKVAFWQVYSDEPVQPPFKLRNSKWCSVNSLTVTE